MAKLILPNQINRQPYSLVCPDWSHPLLFQAEIVLIGMRVFTNPLYGNKAVVNGNQLYFVTSAGLGGMYMQSTYIDVPSFATAEAWTTAGIFVRTNTQTIQNVAGMVDPANRGLHDRTLMINSDRWAGYVFDGATKIVDSGITALQGRPETVIVSANSSTLLIRAGATEVTLGVSNSGYAAYPSSTFSIGYANNTGNLGYTNVPLLVKLRREWSRSERDNFVRNPWQIAKAQQRRLWIAPFASAQQNARPQVFACT